MDDLITLFCPSCGGQLRRGANTATYTSDFCGQQYCSRVEDIKEFVAAQPLQLLEIMEML